jgi:hypothetical protein
MRPPDMTGPACEAGPFQSAAVAGGRFNCRSNADVIQAPPCPPLRTFEQILRGSTPADLLTMVELHRRYVPGEALPASLQRALGAAWVRS